MVRGGPGVGKTAVGLHFLVEGARAGEPVVFLSHGTSDEHVVADAASIGLDASPIRFLDFTPGPDFFAESQSYDLFSAEDVERESFAAELVAEFRRLRPARVFLDALTQVRHLSADLVDFRRQAHAFLKLPRRRRRHRRLRVGQLRPRRPTRTCSSWPTRCSTSTTRASLGRTVTVSKLRGSGFRLGAHSAKIDDNGFHVFPRLLPETFGRDAAERADPVRDRRARRDAERRHRARRRHARHRPDRRRQDDARDAVRRRGGARGERCVVYTFEETADVLRTPLRGVGCTSPS